MKTMAPSCRHHNFTKNDPICKKERYRPNFDDNRNESCSQSSTIHEENLLFTNRKARKIDVTLGDNEELRRTLVDRCENIVRTIIQQLKDGVLPEISYKLTNIDALMEQIETFDPDVNDVQDNYECPQTFDDNPPDASIIKPDSGFHESFESEFTEITEELSGTKKLVSFGSRRSQRKFALIMTTMAKVHQLLIKNRTQTRRSFFYELKSNEETSKLISSQAQIDLIVNNLANLLECTPWDMALVASAKGLASGDLILTFENNELIDYNAPGGALIPQIVWKLTSARTKANFVLVVEKDAVFQKLLDEKCSRALNCIMITGKGYPDVATRMLVNILAEKLALPIYIFVDGDPYGIEIMFTYKYGSMNLSYEPRTLACPSARWIGLYPSDFKPLKIPINPLTELDLAKLDAVQSRPYVTNKVSKQLQIMRRGKAEIEAITRGFDDRDLTSFYISTKIQDAHYI